jgi:hypothetical protein
VQIENAVVEGEVRASIDGKDFVFGQRVVVIEPLQLMESLFQTRFIRRARPALLTSRALCAKPSRPVCPGSSFRRR